MIKKKYQAAENLVRVYQISRVHITKSKLCYQQILSGGNSIAVIVL